MPDCETCNSNLQCASCTTGFFLFEIGLGLNKCVSTCPSGFYLNNAACKPCMDKCKTCSSEGQCALCLPGFVYTVTSDDANKPVCATICNPPNSFVDTTQVCKPCPLDCDTCSSATVCLICKPRFFKTSTLCQACPIGLFRLDN